LEKRYSEAYEKLKKEYIVEDIELDLKNSVEESTPKSWKQAMRSKNRAFWLKACCDEMCAIARIGVFIITRDIRVRKRPLPAKWVFSTKKDVQTGKILKFKVRWVARGDLQKKGVDYKETFAPVASLTTLRILLQLIASEDLELDQMDVVSAFLNGSIDILVFLIQPEGFDLGGGISCLLKSIYGMCQAAKAWYEVLNSVLEAIGFKRLMTDQAVWIRWTRDILQVTRDKPQVIRDKLQVVVAHVDDLLMGGIRPIVDDTKAQLAKSFKIQDLGEAKVFIGLNITRDRAARTISLDQAHYACSILESYQLIDCNAISISIQPGVQLRRGKADEILSTKEAKLY